MRKILLLLGGIVCFIGVDVFGSSCNYDQNTQIDNCTAIDLKKRNQNAQIDNYKATDLRTGKVRRRLLRESPKERFFRLTAVYEKASEPWKGTVLKELQTMAGACDPGSSLKEQIENWASSKGILFTVLDPFQTED